MLALIQSLGSTSAKARESMKGEVNWKEFLSILLIALQPNVRSTGAFVVCNNSCVQEIKPTTQVTTETTIKQVP